MNNQKHLAETRAILNMIERYLKVMNKHGNGENLIGTNFYYDRDGYLKADISFTNHYSERYNLTMYIAMTGVGQIRTADGKSWQERNPRTITRKQYIYIVDNRPIIKRLFWMLKKARKK